MKNPDRYLPESPDAGVRRLSKKPIAVAMIIGTVVLLFLIFSIFGSGEKTAVTTPDPKELGYASINTNSLQNLTSNTPTRGAIPEGLRSQVGQVASPSLALDAQPVRLPRIPAQDTSPETGLPPSPIGTDKVKERIQSDALEEKRRIAKRRQQLLEAAMTAQTKIGTDRLSSAVATQPSAYSGGIVSPTQHLLNIPSAAALAAAASQSSDQNDQDGKEAFREKERPPSYHLAVRQRQISPFELKAGTVIPAVTITGINSDLPGNIIAQVSQNVYDSTTGKILLIPQGSKLIGEYSSRIVWGQQRALQVWTQINFPDGSSIDLGGMDGISQDGTAGFEDKVNKHYARIFGSALLLSLFSAGVEYSQGDSNRGWGERPGVGSTVSASIGQQLAQVGAELMRKEINVQPTITIRPGHLFHVFVKKDLILEPSDVEKAKHGY